MFSLDQTIEATIEATAKPKLSLAEYRAQKAAAASAIDNPVIAQPEAQPEPSHGNENENGAVTETLYRDAEGYSRSAAEQFHGTHDTVAKKWEHKGFVVDVDGIEKQVESIFPHEVEKIQLDNPATGGKSSFHALCYDGDELPISVKKGYVPHTRAQITALTEAAREAFDGQVKVAGTFNDGHFLSVQPTDKYRRSVFGKSDGINPRLIIDAKCGGGSFKASLGWYRDVCNNLTWLKTVSVFSESIRHSSSFADQHEELVEKFRIVAGGWEQTVAFLQSMDSRRVRVASLIKEIYGDIPKEEGSAQTRYVNRVNAIDSIITRERLKLGREHNASDTTATAWEAYNAIQGYTQHRKSRKGSPDLINRAVLAGNDPDVVEAEELLFAEVLLETVAA